MAMTVSSELIALARSHLTPHRFPDVDASSVERRLAEYRCSPNYPEVVAYNMMLARELCVAGCVFWELFTVALHYTAVSAESALMGLFLERLELPFTMRRRHYEKVKKDGEVKWQLSREEEQTFEQRLSLYEFSHVG